MTAKQMAAILKEMLFFVDGQDNEETEHIFEDPETSIDVLYNVNETTLLLDVHTSNNVVTRFKVSVERVRS